MLDNEKDFKLMIICYVEAAHNINMQGNTKIHNKDLGYKWRYPWGIKEGV